MFASVPVSTNVIDQFSVSLDSSFTLFPPLVNTKSLLMHSS